MSLYADSAYPVEADIEALHADELISMSSCGTWWNAAERHAIAVHARAARAVAGVQADSNETTAVALPDAAIEVATAAALGGVNIDRDYYQARRNAGLSEEQYVETVGVVARLAHLDVFARGIGLDPRPLNQPSDNSEPEKSRPAEAIDEGFHCASVPDGKAGGDSAAWIYGEDKNGAANILRSLSLVPEEARRLCRLVADEYMTSKNMGDFSYSATDALDRGQVELIAARVSALNQCFY